MTEPDAEPDGSAADEDRSWRPPWLRFFPFLGTPPALSRRQWRVIGLIAIVNLFDQYDLSLFGLALKQIQEDLAIAEESVSLVGAVVRAGAIPAFLFGPIADRLGRRRVLFFTIVAYTVLTGATAFAPNTETFMVLQFLARIFAVAEVMLAYVVITEELDPDARGWGVGALAALGACGNGLSLILFSTIDWLPGGWRSLYLVGLGPLALIAWMRRSLPETERFTELREHRPASSTLRDAVSPIVSLARVYPGRLLGVGLVIFLLSFAENAAGFFGPKYIQEVHGWTPGQFAFLGLFGGFLAIFGSTFAGRLSDRIGRKPVAIAFLALHPAFVLVYYNTAGWMLPPAWVVMVYCGIGGSVVLATFGNELFPTSYRSTASGARTIIATVGGSLGLAAEGVLYGVFGSHWTAISVLVLGAFAAPLIVALFFPETAGRELEEISPERGPGGAPTNVG